MAQLFDVILNDLRSNKKNVNRLFGVGILFVLFCHFYVVEPYFEYKAQERETRKALEDVEDRLSQLTEQLKHIRPASKRAHKTLSDIRRRIEGYPDHLRNMLPEIDRALKARPSLQRYQGSSQAFQARQPIQQYQRNIPVQAGRIILPPQITTFESGVRWYIEKWFSDLIVELEQEVVNPVIKLKSGQGGAEAPNLGDMAKKASEKLRAHLAGVDPQFWRSYEGGKVPVALELQQVMEESFGPLEREVSKLLKKTVKDIETQEKMSETIKDKLTETQKFKEELESRLDSLESPIGKLPLNLTDLIILFPFLIVILTVMTAVSLHKSSQLCIALWRELKMDKGDADSAAFHRYTDCWYLPPYSSSVQPLVILAWLAVSIAIFLRSSLLVIGEPELFMSLAGEVQYVKRTLFAGLYIVGAIVIVGLAWFIRKTSGQVSQESVG